ncbi:MAG: hypothetical protein ABUL77_00050, partial [Bacteroidota bacterium]
MTGGRSHGDRKEQQPATSIWRLSATALVPLAALAAVGGGCFQPGFGDGEAPGPDALSIPIDLFRQDGGGGGDGDGLRCPPMRATRELTFTFTT